MMANAASMMVFRFFGPCVDGPWQGREIRAHRPIVTIEATDPASNRRTVEFAAGEYAFVHGSLDGPGEWCWREREAAD